MKYRLQNIRLCGNEHGQLKANVICAELANEKGEVEISATLEYILIAIRDRKLDVENVKVEWREYRGALNSEVAVLLRLHSSDREF